MYVHNVVGTGRYTTSTTNMYHMYHKDVPGFALLDLGPLSTRQEMVLQVFVVEGRLFQHQARFGALVDHRVVPESNPEFEGYH